MPPIARLEDVSRLFGTFAALRQVSVEFETGRCYVLLGENGAGKSTLLRILAGLLHPSYGKAVVFNSEGASDTPQRQRGRIGYMSHAPMLYDELTATENLAYFASLYRGQKCLDPADALRSVGLDPALERPVGNYSQGMRQRTSLGPRTDLSAGIAAAGRALLQHGRGQRGADDFAAGKIPQANAVPSCSPPTSGTRRTTGRLLPDTA